MARGTDNPDLTAAQAEALRAGAGLDLAKIQEIAASGRREDVKLRMVEKELNDKLQMAQQDVAGRQKVAETEAGSRRDVANIDVTSRNQVARMDAAVKLLDQVRLAKEGDKKSQTDFLSDIARMPGMKPEDVAGTAAEMGNSAMMNALNKSKANLIDNNLRSQIPGYQKASAADKLKMEAQANLLDPNAGKRLSALAYSAKDNPALAPELSLRQGTTAPVSPTAPVPANTSTTDALNTILKTAFSPTGGGQGAGEKGGAAADRVTGPPVGPPGTAQLSRIEALKAAGQGYVSGDVYNQPAGTEGMDFNTNTGQWVPKEQVGTINGVPANMAVRNPVYSNALVEHGIKPPGQVAAAPPRFMSPELFAPQTTTGQPITPSLTPAPGGGVQISARPDANQYPAPIGPPIVAVNPNVRPPAVDVDKLLQNVVGGPSMEELERRRRSQQMAVLTPFRTTQY